MHRQRVLFSLQSASMTGSVLEICCQENTLKCPVEQVGGDWIPQEW